MFNKCSSDQNPTRNSNCFLIGRQAPAYLVPKEDSGLTEDRYVRIDNMGYRNVKFLIGASNSRGEDKWIITENKKLINIP